MAGTMTRRMFTIALGMLTIPFVAFAGGQDKDKEQKKDDAKKDAEEKKDDAKKDAEDKKDEAKDKAKDAGDKADEAVDRPGTENSEDRRQDRRKDGVKN